MKLRGSGDEGWFRQAGKATLLSLVLRTGIHPMTKKISQDEISNKPVFTTGEAARVCNVSQQTIIRCFDSGRLQGFKVPGSRFRRIPRAELIRFMQQNNMDMDRLETSPVQVLVVGLSAEEVDSVIQTHAGGKEIQIQHADDVWTAGYLAHQCNPGLILLSPSVGVNKASILSTLSDPSRNSEPMIVVVQNDYRNGMSVPSQSRDSNNVIKQAVQQLLSA